MKHFIGSDLELFLDPIWSGDVICDRIGSSISIKKVEGGEKSRGLCTLKPDAARLQRSEVHYGLNSVWMAYLE